MSEYQNLPTSNPLSGGPYVPPPPKIRITSDPIEESVGRESIEVEIQLQAHPAYEVLALVFASATSQTFTQPPNATAFLIVPPGGNTVGLTLKGVEGDTGVAISPFLPSGPISFPGITGGASYTLSAAGAITGAVNVQFA